MSAPSLAAAARSDLRRLAWLLATIGLTAGSLALTIAMAPAASEQLMHALRWLLFGRRHIAMLRCAGGGWCQVRRRAVVAGTRLKPEVLRSSRRRLPCPATR
jgi:hypothetical protein